MIGTEGELLRTMLDGTRGLTPGSILDECLRDHERFRSGSSMVDDLTLTVLRRTT